MSGGPGTTRRPGPIRVLEIRSVRGTGGGPEKTILLGTAQTDRSRFDVTVCYLRDMRDDVFAIDSWANSLGVPYIEVRERHSFDPEVWSALRRIVRERDIDIVHAHEYKTDLLAWLLARRERVVPLSTVHGWSGNSWKERYVYYPADRRVLARFPHLIAVSDVIRRTLVESGADPARITTVLNAIDPDAFRRDRAREPLVREALGIAPDEVVVGSIGRLEFPKRFDLLIDAVAELRPAMPRLRCMIVGDGSLRPPLEARAAARGVTDIVTFLGHRTDAPDLHHAFDVFVHPSDSEGTPNAVLEAMALETPIVASDVGGTAELAHHDEHALIVRKGDGPALTAALGRLLEHPELARRLASAARRRTEHELSFRARMARVESVYEALVGDPSADATSSARMPR